MDDEIEKWKLKKIVKFLNSAVGISNTSMITLAIPPSKSINYVSNMLTTEYGTASNIKSRVNRLSVLSALTSVHHKLKPYKSTPKNGLIIYSGNIAIDGNKDKKVTYDIIPFKPIKQFIYFCDNKFHTESLSEILESNEKYGFLIMDGLGALFATLCGNDKNILYKFTVALPNKHRKGGQSALRMARLREEARTNYLRKTGEYVTKYFITNDLPNIKGLILAGNADLKTDFSKSVFIDPRLKKIILTTLDVQYGGLNGLSQAIELSSNILSNVKLLKEKKVIDEYFEEIRLNKGKYCFGIQQTCEALEQGAVEKLIVWEELAMMRNILTDFDGNEVIHYTKTEKEPVIKVDEKTEKPMDIKESREWVDWLSENYKQYGTSLKMVSDRTQQGSQFVNGFGGIGCILRWNITFEEDFANLQELDNNANSDEDVFDDDISAFL